MKTIEQIKLEEEAVNAPFKLSKADYKALSGYLTEDEIIKGIATGEVSWQLGLTPIWDKCIMICTTKRVVFVKHKLLGKDFQDMMLNQIVTIGLKKGLLTADMWIQLSGVKKKVKIQHVGKEEADLFVAAVQNQLVTQNGGTVPTVSKVEKLQQLKELLDEEILTQEEFEQEKAKILAE